MTPPPPLPLTRVNLDQSVDPHTGWTMLGVGAEWSGPVQPDDLRAEVLYDGVVVLREPVRRLAVTDGHAVHTFGTRLPLDPAARLTVRLVAGGRDVVLFSGPATTLPDPARLPPPRPRPPRWLSPVLTTGRALATGQLFTVRWWDERRRRYAAIAARAGQKLQDRKHARRAGPRDAYAVYARTCTPTAADLAAMRRQAEGFRRKPVISLLCPVFNAPPAFLRELVASVQAQAYPHWELCLADDASTDPATRAALDRLPRDPRIKLVRRPQNGHICAATNSAAGLAAGEFVALVDNDDVLAPHALFRVAELLQQHPDADLIYSDEDKLDAAGRRYDPQFKPAWSPELLLSYNYVNHLTVMRRALFEAVGRFRVGYEGSQDHDLLLRLTERTDRVHHVPEVLYHWRAHAGSTAASAGQKSYVHTSGRKAVADALARRGVDAALYQPPFAEKLGLPILALDGPDDGPAVAVVVRGPAAAAAQTVRAVKAVTSYRHLTTYLVLDGEPPADALNRLAAGRGEEFLLFLEAGVEPADPRWLSRLVAYARLPGVGACGGLIAGDPGRVVSAGTRIDGHPADAFAGPAPEPVSYYFYAESARDVAAPGRGCLLTRRADFERAGGFDADRFGHTLYDVDYCRRLAGLGLRSVHVGGAELRWAAADAGRHDRPTERAALRAAHPDPDPFAVPKRWDALLAGPETGSSPAAGLPVLFGTHNLSATEGAPKVIRDVAVALHAAGAVRASLFAPRPAAGADAAGLPVFADDLPFAPRYIDGRWTPPEYVAALRHLRRVFRRARPGAVVANTVGLFPLAEAAARAGLPAVLCVQETYPPPRRAGLFSPFARGRLEWAMRHAGRVLFASRDCAAAYADLGLGNAVVVPNGLDPAPLDAYLARVCRAEAAAGLRPARFRFVAVGTVCERKAQHVLVEAAAVLARTRRDFVCHLVGAREGLPYLHFVRELAAARGVADLVDLVPETPDVWPYLRAADAFVCCSHGEAYSLSVLEGLAFGLPVVSTPCGGLSEQVVWGVNALRYGFDDAPALAGHLGRLMADDALRAEMGRQARAGFDQLPTAAEVTARYAGVIAAAARRAG